MSETLAAILLQKPQKLRMGLSAHTRQANEIGQVVELATNNWMNFAEGHLGTPVSQKIERLLKLIADRSEHPGRMCVLILSISH